MKHYDRSSWKASNQELRSILILEAFIRRRPITYSELRNSVSGWQEFKAKQTLIVYLKALVQEGVFNKVRTGDSKRYKYQVADDYVRHSGLLKYSMGSDLEIFSAQLRELTLNLSDKMYGSQLEKKSREKLLAKALMTAYELYIPLHLMAIREAVFQTGSYGGALTKLVTSKITDEFLAFAENLRRNIPKIDMTIANHNVWGWNQTYNALPRIIGNMWRKQQRYEKLAHRASKEN